MSNNSCQAAPLVFVLVGGLIGGHTANAQTFDTVAAQAAPASAPTRDAWNWILPAAFFGGTLLIPTPGQCRWCDRDGAGHDTLNGFDRSVRSALLWNHTTTADALSWVTGLSPVALLAGLDWNDFPETALPVFEAVGTNYLVTHVVKIAAARERPVVHFGGTDAHGPDVSFFSGHSSDAFALVFALARVKSDRGDPNTKWVWIAGVPLAATTAYLRIAADKHYATDVLTGAAVGAVLGWTTPGWWGHSAKSNARVLPIVSPKGASLLVRWHW